MDDTAGLEGLEVAQEEARGSQALRHLLHLRIGEGNPDLVHLPRGEEAPKGLDLTAQEGHIAHPCLMRSLSPRPDACPLDVHADEVLLRIDLCEAYGVLALATAQLEDDGMIVVEEILSPASLQREGLLLEASKGVLEDMGEGLHLGELRQLILSHPRD